MNKRRPTHPGAILREDILPEIALDETELATLLNISPRIVREIINERRPVSTDVALRLARVFKTTPEFWLRLQQAVDIWETQGIKQAEYGNLKPFVADRAPKLKIRNKRQIKASRSKDEPCELCGKPMVLKQGRFGEFLGCSDYPSCRNIRKAA